MKDYYSILGVSIDASQELIKKAYREKAKQFHPDKNSGSKEFEEKLKIVIEAYSILSDLQSKTKYDLKFNTWYSNSKKKEDSSKTDDNSKSNSKHENTNQDSKRNNMNNDEPKRESSKSKSNEDSNSTKKSNSIKMNLKKHFHTYLYYYIVLLIVLSMLAISYIDEINTFFEKFKNEHFSSNDEMIDKQKIWLENQDYPSLKFTNLLLKTKLKEDKMMYIISFNVDPNDNKILNSNNPEGSIQFNFLDKDKFLLFTLNVPITNLTTKVDNNLNIIGYDENSKINIDKSLYSQFSSCTLSYIL